jgi:hypothetical protein
LRLTNVWPGVTAPWCVLFARNEKAPPRAAFHFVSPQLETSEEHGQEDMRIDWLDASQVAVSELEDKPWLLKARFRGTPLDESALNHVLRNGVPLGKYLKELNASLKVGYKAGGAQAEQQSARSLHGLRDLGNKDPPGFVVDVSALPLFSRKTLHRTRGISNYMAPLLLVRESLRVHELAPRSILAYDNLAFNASFYGASFANIDEGSAIARYLQVVMQSRYTTWFELLTDARFGVERDTVLKSNLLELPVTPWSLLTSAQREVIETLAKRMRDNLDESLLREIDELVFGFFGLFRAQRDAIYDTLATASTTTEAKKTSTRCTTTAERKKFASRCERALNDVLAASHTSASVICRADLDQPGWRFMQINRLSKVTVPKALQLPSRFNLITRSAKEMLPNTQPRLLADLQWRTLAEKSGASLVTIVLDPSCMIVALIDRYRYWTETRAELLAMSIFSKREGGA